MMVDCEVMPAELKLPANKSIVKQYIIIRKDLPKSICAGASFLIKLQGESLQLFKKTEPATDISFEFC